VEKKGSWNEGEEEAYIKSGYSSPPFVPGRDFLSINKVEPGSYLFLWLLFLLLSFAAFPSSATSPLSPDSPPSHSGANLIPSSFFLFMRIEL